MPRSTFRIATALVTPDDNRSTESGISLFKEMCAWLRNNVPQCKCLTGPAGYFKVRSTDEAPEIFDKFVRALDDDLLTTFTFDVRGAKSSPNPKDRLNGKHQVDGHLLSFYGCLVEARKQLGNIAQQLGRSSGNIEASVASVHVKNRTHTSSLLGDRSVALSLCGELLSSPWRKALAGQAPSLILNPSHKSVKLAGNPRRSWEPHINELLSDLPQSTWAFADHVHQLEHRANSQPVPLVHGGRDTRVRRMTDSGSAIANACLYIYEVQLAQAQ